MWGTTSQRALFQQVKLYGGEHFDKIASLCTISTLYVFASMRHLFSDDESDEDESTRPLANLCCYMTQVWLSTAQRVRVVVSQYMAMRREKISSMAKTAMPFCTEEEIEAFVEHDDGVHIHKLIAAVNRVMCDS